MKTFKRILQGVTAGLLLFAASLAMANPGIARAIPYNGDNTVGLNTPAFNVFTGTSHSGDEPDFFRGKVDGTTDSLSDPLNASCTPGQKLKLRVYVHNAAKDTLNGNGNGVGVAKNTKVRVQIPGTTAKNFDLTSTITSSNAPTATDGLRINCSGEEVQLSYVAGSAYQLKQIDGASVPISDSIVNGGAPIGTYAPNGDMWGCWDQRVYVFLIVEVKKKPTPPPQILKCESLAAVHLGDRKFRFTAKASTQNGATISSYIYEFGDGTSQTNNSSAISNSIDHTYNKAGEYTAIVSVKGKVDGKDQTTTGPQCKVKINIPEKPVVPPTVTPEVTPDVPTSPPSGKLPDTGIAGAFGLFAGTSVLGTVVHRFVSRLFGRA